MLIISYIGRLEDMCLTYVSTNFKCQLQNATSEHIT